MAKKMTIILLLVIHSFCGSKEKEGSPKLESVVKQELSKPEEIKVTTEVNKNTALSKPPTFNYDLNAPDLDMKLPSTLLEISGLSYDNSEDVLLAINDEKGRLYKIDKKQGEIIDYLKFGKKGDYEGVEKAGDQIYVTNSSGTLFAIHSKPEVSSTKIRTSLREINDVEGLGYDAKTNALLLACKGKPNVLATQKFKKTKAIYSYNIKDSSLVEDPFMIIKDKDLEYFVEHDKSHDHLPTEELKKLKKRIKSFSPSGIALHPKEDHFYMISSVGKSMVVLDRNAKIKSVQFLDETIHRQPEGICFDNSANLYISNEGKFGIAKIYKFIPS